MCHHIFPYKVYNLYSSDFQFHVEMNIILIFTFLKFYGINFNEELKR
jgi:hypothetical protein